jgi:hypothetical protein
LGTTPPLKIFGGTLPTPDGTCVRDYIHVSDLARAHVHAATYLMNGGDVVALNLGTGKGTSLKQLLAEIETITGRVVPRTVVGPRLGDPPVLYADPTRAQRLFQWEARHDLGEIIRTAYAWELRFCDRPGTPGIRRREVAIREGPKRLTATFPVPFHPPKESMKAFLKNRFLKTAYFFHRNSL